MRIAGVEPSRGKVRDIYDLDDKLLIENPRDDWPVYNRQALEFLDITPHFDRW